MQEVKSYIINYLTHNNEFEVINQFQIKPFSINVQCLEGTFIDNIFKISDYTETQKLDRNSRHLYDVHKILKVVQFNREKFQLLFDSVRKERQLKLDRNVTSIKGCNIVQTLQIIIEKDVFKKDYKDIIQALLFEEVSYEEVKGSLYALIQQGLIP
ncbi:MAG: nucleotidyl transferase AbiEii/AbiGii toxin family protein [Eubacteriaceae bacterium]